MGFQRISAALVPVGIREALGIRAQPKKPVTKKKTKPLAAVKYPRVLSVRKSTTPEASIYVLQLAQGYVYVGKSSNIARRLGQHMDGLGARFTKRFKPTGRLLPRLGTLTGGGDGPERDETLRQMDHLGPQKVRGWKFCSAKLSIPDLREIEDNIRELKDLCRKCGRPGHFAMRCCFKVDRHGKSTATNRKKK
jgi:hypothetical protein